MTLVPGKTKAALSLLTMQKKTNIFDPIQKELDQKVFNGITPRPRVLKFITDEMRKVLTPILGFDPMEFMDLYLTGSLTTYQYGDTSDCDISVFIKWDLWPTGEDPNQIRRKIIPVVMNQLDGTELPGTRHPIQHFVVPPGVEPKDLYQPGLRSAFSFRDLKWIVPPEKDRVHDVSVELPVLWHRAKLMEDKMNVLLGVNPIYAKEFWHQIHRKRQQDQKAGLGDFSEGNIVYKMLLHDGYFDRIRDELGEKISKRGVSLDEYFEKRAGMGYHVASVYDRESIQSHGLDWNMGESAWRGMENDTSQYPEANYLWTSLWDAEHYASSDDDIWQVDYSGLDVVQDPAEPGLAIYVTEPIPSNRLKLVRPAERMGKTAWDENFSLQDYDSYVPPVGSVWTMSDPWALTKNPPGPAQRTVEVTSVESRYVWYRDLDRQTGLDQNDGMSIRSWNDKMSRGIIRQKTSEWNFQESPEEGAEQWPDTLPQNWSKQAATLRLFIAFDPPDNVIEQIMQWQQANLPEGARPHPADNLHMTLAFLGNTEEEHVPELLRIISQLDPASVFLSGPTRYEEIRGKQGVLVWDEQGGNELWQHLNQLLHEWNGYTPQYDPWLPHTTVWEYPGGTGQGFTPELPVIGTWSPTAVHLFKSEKNPAGGGIFTAIGSQKTAWPWQQQTDPTEEWLQREQDPASVTDAEWRSGEGNQIPVGTNVHDPNLCPTCGREKNPGSDFCPYCGTPYGQTPDPEVQKQWGWHPSQYPAHIPISWVDSMPKNRQEKGSPHPPHPEPPYDQQASPQMIEWMRSQMPEGEDYLNNWLEYNEKMGRPGLETHQWLNGLNRLKDYDYGYHTDYKLTPRQPKPPPQVFQGKTADDLSWVDKSTPYGTPDGGFIGGPEHWGDDSIDMPSEPSRDLAPPDNVGLKDPKGSLKVIYDFERDQIILGDVKKAEQFPPGQIIGDYRDGDVYLNDHAEAWFNANYFKRLWQHSFPKRPIRHVILDKGDGHHEVVHRAPTSAILGTYEDHQEDQEGLEDRLEEGDQAQPEGAELLQVEAAEEYGDYYWPDPQEIMQTGVDAVEATGQPHPGFREGAEGAIDSARGAAINRHVGMFGSGGSNDPYELAGHLIWRIQATQMAIDGNKRMAAASGLAWLSMHGYDVSHLPQDDSFFKVVEASSTMNEDEGPALIAEFLRQYVKEEPDDG